MIIIRGTTPDLKFTLPFATDIVEVGFVVIKQSKVMIIEKRLSDCECDGNVASVKLTQEETLKLAAGQQVEINLVVKTLDGGRLESKPPFILKVEDTSKEGVI